MPSAPARYGTPSKTFMRVASMQRVADARADLREDVADEARAAVEVAAVAAVARAGAEQFVQQVGVALLDVDEVEADVAREHRGFDEAILELLELVVGDQVARDVRTASIAAPCCAMIGAGVRPAAGVRELHADEEAVGRCRSARGGRRASRRAGASVPARCRGEMRSWRGLARASGTTAVASPQSSAAPPCAKRRQRRNVSSPGVPSRLPSQPSIGCTAMRFDAVRSPMRTGLGDAREVVGDADAVAAFADVGAEFVERAVSEVRHTSRVSAASTRRSLPATSRRPVMLSVAKHPARPGTSALAGQDPSRCSG